MNFRELGEIATANLSLEPLRRQHAVEMYAVLCDASLWEYTEARAPSSIDELTSRYARLESTRSPDGLERWLNWIVRRKLDKAALGFVQATVTDREAEIAYVFGRSSWGRGYAREAVAAMMRTLQCDHGVDTMIAHVDSRNARSIRLLEHVGFEVVDSNDVHSIRYELASLPHLV